MEETMDSILFYDY